MLITWIDKLRFAMIAGLAALLPIMVTGLTADIFAAPKIALLRLCAAVLLALWAIRAIASRRVTMPRGPLALIMLAFIAIVMISAYLSADPAISFLGLRKRYFGASTYLSLGVIFASTSAVTWNYRRLRLLAWTVAGAAGSVGLVGLAQLSGSTWPADLTAIFGSSVYSTFGNPNMLGAYLAMTVPLGLALVRVEPEQVGKVVAAGITMIAVSVVFLTRSNGAFFGLIWGVAVFGAMTWLLAGRRQRAIAVVAGLFIITALLTTVLASSNENATQRRLFIWNGAIKMIAAQPLTGSGPDLMRYAVPPHLSSKYGFHTEIPEDAHNLPLTTAATAGLPALIALVALSAIGIRAAVRHASNDTGRAGILISALPAVFAGYFAGNMVNPDNLASLLMFFIILGIVSARAWKTVDLRLPMVPLSAIAVVVAGLSVSALMLATFPFLSEVRLSRAENASDTSAMLASFRAAEQTNPYYDWYAIRITDRLLPEAGPGHPRVTAEALDAVDRAIEKAPREADNYAIKGSVYLKLAGDQGENRDELDQAIRQYRLALAINPNHLIALKNMIVALYLRADLGSAELTEAIDRYQSLAADPDVEEIRRSIKR